jgi:hypothetical protein
MTSRVDLCLQEAAECERRAALEKDDRIRQALTEMARYWCRMAELAADFERREQSLGKPENSRHYPVNCISRNSI